MKHHVKYLFHSLFHPFAGFDGVKFEGEGSLKLSFILAFVFFLQNVISTAGTGFLFRTGNPDDISVPMIFAVTMAILILWVTANWAVGSLMDTEGKLRETIIVTTYALVPYIIVNIINTIISNFATLDMLPFMNMLSVVFTLWSLMILFVGLFVINQTSFTRVLGMSLLSLIGMLVIVFIGVLAYSLFQQMYIFGYTIFNEIMFRL